MNEEPKKLLLSILFRQEQINFNLYRFASDMLDSKDARLQRMAEKMAEQAEMREKLMTLL